MSVKSSFIRKNFKSYFWYLFKYTKKKREIKCKNMRKIKWAKAGELDLTT